MRSEHKEEAAMSAILRAWNAAPDGPEDSPLGAIVRELTSELTRQGLAKDGALSEAARTMLRRVDARARAAAKLKKAGAS